MSRIDEALSRAGNRARFFDSGQAGSDVFVSPWALSGDDTQKTASGQPVTDDVSTRTRREPDESTPILHVARQSLVEQFRPEWKKRLLVWRDADPRLVEQFGRLAGKLVQRQRTDSLKSLIIASAMPSDGKTLTALNLALVVSESYRHRVLLIDADLRRPTIGEAANLAITDGLNEAIKASNERKAPLVQLTETLTVLPAGGPEPDPLSNLTSPRMQRLLQEAAVRFDWVIVDSPPIRPTADAGLLCPMVDAAILVIRAGQTPYSAVQQAIDALGRERILGIVLNAVEVEIAPGYGYYKRYSPRDS